MDEEKQQWATGLKDYAKWTKSAELFANNGRRPLQQLVSDKMLEDVCSQVQKGASPRGGYAVQVQLCERRRQGRHRMWRFTCESRLKMLFLLSECEKPGRTQ